MHYRTLSQLLTSKLMVNTWILGLPNSTREHLTPLNCIISKSLVLGFVTVLLEDAITNGNFYEAK